MSVHWETDRGLRLRMGLALGLVVVLPVAFVYAFVFLANTVGVALLEFATERPWTGRFYVEPWVVLAHELAHVKNKDVSVMTLAHFLPTLTYLVATAAYYVLDDGMAEIPDADLWLASLAI